MKLIHKKLFHHIFYALSFCIISLSLNGIELKKGIQTICVPQNTPMPCKKSQVPVDIFVPQNKSIGNILVLNGWNFPRDDWQKKTKILSIAEEKSFTIIFPEMGKTLYETDYFPETKMKWFSTPGGKWASEDLIISLQELNLLKENQKNFVMGLSTGGRGAVILGYLKPNIFKAVASISGDFDQSKMPKDRIMTNVYGSFESFEDRWKTIDNPQNKIAEWKLPIYLGHGKKDVIVPFVQTENFFKALKEKHMNLKIIFNEPKDSGHDYKYWDSEVKPILDFFGEI